VLDAVGINALIIAMGSPNRTKENKIVQCAIAVTKELGLIRVFADYRGLMQQISVWDECKIDIAKSSKDNRAESFKLCDLEIIGKVLCPREKRKILNDLSIDEPASDPIDYQNSRRLSIAVVKPMQNLLGIALENREPKLCEDYFVSSGDMPHRAYLTWQTQNGKKHTSHICSHEVMEGLRKNPSSPMRVFENTRVHDFDWEKWLVIGTMVKHRSSWVIVHVHRLKKTTGVYTAGSLWTGGGKKDGWPYLNKEDVCARRAEFEPQKYLFTI
jgi:hypothetical protein